MLTFQGLIDSSPATMLLAMLRCYQWKHGIGPSSHSSSKLCIGPTSPAQTIVAQCQAIRACKAFKASPYLDNGYLS